MLPFDTFLILMTTLSIRLDDRISKEFDQLCKHEGYKKNGLIVRLITDFLHSKKVSIPSISFHDISSIEGKVSLGGNALDDTEQVFDHE